MGQGERAMWGMTLSQSPNSKLPRAAGTSPERAELNLEQSWKVHCEMHGEPVRCAPRQEPHPVSDVNSAEGKDKGDRLLK